MLKALFLIIIVAVIGVLLSSMLGQAPLRGLAHYPGSPESILLSRAKPPVTFALEPGLSLQKAGWCDVHPETMENIDGDAKMWLALYRHPRGLVVTAVADTQGRWEWDAGHHAAYKPLRSLERRPQDARDVFSVWETVTVLDRKHDPFCGGTDEGTGARQDTGSCLVYRAKMILEFSKCAVFAEYHEDLPENLAADIAYEDRYLTDFTQRARKACQIKRLSKEETEALAQDIAKMDVLDKGISRRSLAKWTGRMHRPGRP